MQDIGFDLAQPGGDKRGCRRRGGLLARVAQVEIAGGEIGGVVQVETGHAAPDLAQFDAHAGPQCVLHAAAEAGDMVPAEHQRGRQLRGEEVHARAFALLGGENCPAEHGDAERAFRGGFRDSGGGEEVASGRGFRLAPAVEIQRSGVHEPPPVRRVA